MLFNDPPQAPNWRLEPSLISAIICERKFALIPVKCLDGTKVWFKHYYSVNKHWSHNSSYADARFMHIDKIGNITEAEYIIYKLTKDN